MPGTGRRGYDSDLGKKKKTYLAIGRFTVVGTEMNITENNL